jgi:DNA mismatch repair protein MutL
MLVAAPVGSYSERVYQVFGPETLERLIPVAANMKLERVGIPEPPPWRRDENYAPRVPGDIRVHGFVSKPEVQKLNRNSIFIFVNGRLVRDRLIQHALTEAYRNILPPTVFPVVLLFIELPSEEVDANVHPSKVEVRFRQQTLVHDFVRDSARAALMKARPVPQFTREITAQPTAAPALTPSGLLERSLGQPGVRDEFILEAPVLPAVNKRLEFTGEPIAVEVSPAVSGFGPVAAPALARVPGHADGCGNVLADEPQAVPNGLVLASLKPLGQVRDSFIVAVNADGLWIIDQHVAHERILFEKILKERAQNQGLPQGQRLLMPLILELTAAQQAVFAEIFEELGRNGFEAELFGGRTLAVKTAPAGIESAQVGHMLPELLDRFQQEEQTLNLETIRMRIAATIACHAAIKVNMALEQNKMEWLLRELAKTDCPMSCPHGRPVVLRYSVNEIQRAFKRI